MSHPLRPELQAVLQQLFAVSEKITALSLDAVGEALGTLSVSTDEIDALFSALEEGGRTVDAPPGGGLEPQLRAVVAASAALRAEIGRRPTLGEVAVRAGLTPADVRNVLFLLRIMQR